MTAAVLSVAPDIAEGQLTHDNLSEGNKVELKYAGLVRMPKRVLQQLWKEGLNMPNATYAMLAMYADGIGGTQELQSFDEEDFIERWALSWEVEKKGKAGEVDFVVKEKRLTHADIAKVISSFEKKDRAISKRSDIQLKIVWEGGS